MAEFRDLIEKQQINTPPANKNTGGVLIQKSLERIEVIQGEVLPAIDNNSIKMFSELKKHTKILESILSVFKADSSKNTTEDKQEAQRVVLQQAKAIDKIEENTRSTKPSGDKKDLDFFIKEAGIGMALGAVAGDMLHRGTEKPASTEERQEAQRIVAHQAETIEKIEENTRPTKPSGDKKDKSDFKLGGIATALAAAIGGIIAAFKAQIKTIQLFAKALLPESWLNALRKKTASFISGLSMAYDSAKTAVIEQFGVVRKFLSDVLGSVKSFFMGEGAVVSTLRKIFVIAKKIFTTLAEPFVELNIYIRRVAKFTKAFSPITKAISGISGWINAFGKTISKVSSIALRLFKPLTVILTLWDTVKGAIEGFEKDGIVGAIGGAIKGFFNSLVFGFVDVIKSAVSWILGALGFEKLEKFLDSFSFTDIFSGFVDLIVDLILRPVETLGKLMDGLGKAMDEYIVNPMKEAFKPITDFVSSLKDSILGALQSIHIPEISFTIPVIDKKVSIGPFYPFGKPGSSNQTSASSPAAAPQPTQNAPASAASPSTPPAASPSTPPSAKSAPVNAQAQPASVPTQIAMPEKPSMQKNDIIPRSGQVAQPGSSVIAPPTGIASNVYQQSAQNAGAAQPSSAPGGNVVVAPTTNVSNKTTNNIVRMPSRNNDTTLSEYFKSRYAF